MTSRVLRDIILVPNLLTLVRFPLALLFVLALDDPRVAILVLAIAALSDVADGWYARRYGEATRTGAILDAVADKVFALAAVGGLLVVHRLSVPQALLLGVRDVGEAMLWVAHRRRGTSGPFGEPALYFGKATTTLQLATIVMALLGSRFLDGWAVATAVIGVFAVVQYWRRASPHGET